MPLKNLHLVLLVLLLLIGFSLRPRSSFANYTVPKLAIDLGLGLTWPKEERQSTLAYTGLMYELDSSWALMGDYIHEMAHSTATRHQVSLGGRYRIDFLRLRPWFALRVGAAIQDSVKATLGASVGLSYFLSEHWQLSLWSLALYGGKGLWSEGDHQDLTKLYYLFSISYDFTLGEDFDEL